MYIKYFHVQSMKALNYLSQANVMKAAAISRREQVCAIAPEKERINVI